MNQQGRGTGQRKDNGYAPLTKVAGMWQHTSKKGATYFVGRIGDAKVLLLSNPDWTEGGKEPTHNLCVSHAPRQQQRTGDAGRQPATSGRQPDRRPATSDGRSRNAGVRPPPPDDSDRF